MLEYLIVVQIALTAIVSSFFIVYYISKLLNLTANQLGEDQKEVALMTNENLNNVAGALIGLSELLEEADQVIDEISRVPSVGDILQQALQGFIMQKMSPMLPPGSIQPIGDVISEKMNALTHGEGQRESETEKTTEI